MFEYSQSPVACNLTCHIGGGTSLGLTRGKEEEDGQRREHKQRREDKRSREVTPYQCSLIGQWKKLSFSVLLCLQSPLSAQARDL